LEKRHFLGGAFGPSGAFAKAPFSWRRFQFFEWRFYIMYYDGGAIEFLVVLFFAIKKTNLMDVP
jgi:hypothetical protein